MHIKLNVNELKCLRTTDVSGSTLFGLGSNDRDEVYFVVAGASSSGKIAKPRVSPPAPEDYFGIKARRSVKDIVLWEGDLSEGQEAFLTVLVREQDNAQLTAIEDAVTGVVATVAGVFSQNAQLTTAGLIKLGEAAKHLVDSLVNDGDQTIGAFTVKVKVQSGLVVEWAPVSNASTKIQSSNGPSAVMGLRGANSRYTLNAGIPESLTNFVGVFRQGNYQDGLYSSDLNSVISNWEYASQHGLRLIDFDTYVEAGTRFFTGVYGEGTDSYYLWIGVPWDQFVAKWNELGAAGLRLISISCYVENNFPLFTGVFRAGTDDYALYSSHWEGFERNWQHATQNGLRLVSIATYKIGNQPRQFVGVYRAGTDGHGLYAADWTGFEKNWSQASSQGLRLVDIATYDEGDTQQYLGVYREGTDGYALINTDWNGFTEYWKDARSQGLRLVAVATYQYVKDDQQTMSF